MLPEDPAPPRWTDVDCLSRRECRRHDTVTLHGHTGKWEVLRLQRHADGREVVEVRNIKTLKDRIVRAETIKHAERPQPARRNR